MAIEHFNGKRECSNRIYGTLKYFLGENATYDYGDVLFVSTTNDEDYDLILQPNGRISFVDLYNEHKDDPMPPVPGGSINNYVVVDSLPKRGVKNLVYRVPGVDTYSDWMYEGGEWKKLATYDGQLASSQEVASIVTDFSYDE